MGLLSYIIVDLYYLVMYCNGFVSFCLVSLRGD